MEMSRWMGEEATGRIWNGKVWYPQCRTVCKHDSRSSSLSGRSLIKIIRLYSSLPECVQNGQQQATWFESRRHQCKIHCVWLPTRVTRTGGVRLLYTPLPNLLPSPVKSRSEETTYRKVYSTDKPPGVCQLVKREQLHPPFLYR